MAIPGPDLIQENHLEHRPLKAHMQPGCHGIIHGVGNILALGVQGDVEVQGLCLQHKSL